VRRTGAIWPLALLTLCSALTACEATIDAPTATKAWTFESDQDKYEGWNWNPGQMAMPSGATFVWKKDAGRAGSAIEFSVPFTAPDQIADFTTFLAPTDLRGKTICASVEYTLPEAPDLSAIIAVYASSNNGNNYVDTTAAPTGGWQVVCLSVDDPKRDTDSLLARDAITQIGVSFFAGDAPTTTTILLDDVAY